MTIKTIFLLQCLQTSNYFFSLLDIVFPQYFQDQIICLFYATCIFENSELVDCISAVM